MYWVLESDGWLKTKRVIVTIVVREFIEIKFGNSELRGKGIKGNRSDKSP